ncbi:hypothetical protein [Empedobacter brevis]|uniref:hypothetical protein n=1 Tax=Empedobacter brevis TaxID=247 RepID=UPI00289C34A2|nr:hypothetical protein [Empedobacter brevis]
MTVENLFTDVLNNLVKAQYESYVFSQRLGAQDHNLLPIPTAEIKEITLDVNYAYEDKEEFGFKESYDICLIIEELSDMLKTFFQQYQKRIIGEVNMSDKSLHEEWSEIKKNLSLDKMTHYMLERAKADFLKSADNFFNSSKKNTPLTTDQVLIFLESTIQHTVNECIIKHIDMKQFIENVNVDEINSYIHSSINKNAQFIKDVVQRSIKQVPKKLNIIVDAHLLENLPPEAIQKAKVVMKMRNIIVEK